MTDILVVGDPHAHPGYDNDRFGALGALAADRGVDRVHCTGDWADFPSLCKHAKRLELDEASYEEDVLAASEALGLFELGLDGYPVEKTITLGNHDTRPETFVADNPRFRGKVSWKDVPYVNYGWRVTGFRRATKIAGFACSHHFPSGVMGRPIGGEHHAHSLLKKNGQSTIVGHDHRFDSKIMTRGDGSKMWAFSAGCAMHPRYREAWCRDTEKFWDRGALILRGARRGVVEGFEWIGEKGLR